MKTFVAILLLVTPVLAQQFGDDNAGAWLPVPDGYVWPLPLKDAPRFEATRSSFISLSPELRRGLESNWPGSAGRPESIEMLECDLNSDGRKEVFVHVREYSGTGGPFYVVLTHNDNTYRRVGDLQGWGFVLHQPKQGWLQIEGMSRGGGGNYTRYLLAYNGKEYETVRLERHDFNRRNVEIAK